MGASFYIFGTGRFCELVLEKIKNRNICGLVDNSEEKVGTVKSGFVIDSFDEFLKKYKTDIWVIIAASPWYEMEMAEQLINAGVLKFVFLDEIELFDACNYEEILCHHSSRLLEYYRENNWMQRECVSFFMNHMDSRGIVQARGYNRKRQRQLIEYAENVLEDLYKIGISPFLIGINLLGKYRNNGFFSWNEDLNFGVFRNEYRCLVDYCNEYYRVVEVDGKLGNHNKNNEYRWLDLKFKEDSGTFLVVYPSHLQINYGSCFADRMIINFWCFDRFGEKDFGSYSEIIKELKTDVENKCYDDQLALLYSLRERTASYKDCDGNNIYFSVETEICTLKTNVKWIDKEIIFPLKKIEYEGARFFSPNKIEDYLKFEFEDLSGNSNDYGMSAHFKRNEYIRMNYITVEFYLVDAFEIYHFKPLYEMLRKHGIYAIFVAEPNEINSSGNWFDYKTAINILNELELEFSENCNVDADIAFTTQYANSLRKYRRAIKVNITYGCSFNRNAIWFDKRAINGFDYKLVSGEFIKQKCLGHKILDDEHILVMGSPKHYGIRNRVIANDLLDKLNIKTEKKILCYFPTWDDDSSISKFSRAIEELKDEYFIVTKPHHCTFRLPEKKNELDILYKMSDVVLDGNYNFESVANVGDIRICDAKSGSALECVFVNSKIPLILLSMHEKVDEYFYADIFDVPSDVLYNPSDLKRAVKRAEVRTNIDVNQYFDCSKTEEDLWDITKRIIRSVNKEELIIR